MSPDIRSFNSDDNVIRIEERLGSPRSPGPPLEPPGGGDGGMEARIKRLEEDVKEIRMDVRTVLTALGDIKGGLNSLTTKVDALPTAKEYALVAAKVSELPSGKEFGAMQARLDGVLTSGKFLTYLGIATAIVGLLLRWTDLRSFVRAAFGV